MPATTPSDDTLASYRAEIGRYPLLTAREELRLARLTASGDQAAKRRLIESNLRLVVVIARRHRGLGLDLLDLIQEGNLGLLAAVERFDWRRGVRFSTYASWWIRRAIHLALSTTSRTIRIPRRVAESATRVKRAEGDLAQRLGRRASAEEVARVAGVDVDTVATLRRAELVPVSLSDAVTEDGDRLEELLSDEGAADPAAAVADGDAAQRTRSALATLPRRNRRLLELRYGLDGQPPRTYATIAGEVGLSRARVQYLETRSLDQLAGRPELQALLAA